MPRQDTIVVGGGLAGLIIARELCAAGLSVTLLEARHRLGGRLHFESVDHLGESVELGGQWFDPHYQPLITAEVERYGLEMITVDGSGEGDNRRRLPGPLPVPWAQIDDLERGIWECLAAARRIEYGRPWEEQGLDDLDVSWADYVRGLRLSPSVEQYLLTWMWAADPEQSSALNVLVLFATFGRSAWAVFRSTEVSLGGGTRSLIEAILAEIRCRVCLGAVVSEIQQDTDGVVVRTVDGRGYSSSNAVLATPVNTWADVTFIPPLSTAKQEAAGRKHVGSGQKIWIELNGMPEDGVAGAQAGEHINWLTRDRRLPNGADLYVGFTGARGLDLADHDFIRDCVRVFAPKAEVVSAFGYEWQQDPFSRGVWAVYRPGHFTRLHGELSQPEGRLNFAGSDVSFGQQRWMEGALETAFQVVDRLLRRG